MEFRSGRVRRASPVSVIVQKLRNHRRGALLTPREIPRMRAKQHSGWTLDVCSA